MGVIHMPRIAAAIARGYYRRSHPLDKNSSFAFPHIASRRAGLFDIDLYGHMNNAGRLTTSLPKHPPAAIKVRLCAAYLTHFELARWELSAQNGILDWSVRQRAAFIIGGVYLRFRREVKPFQAFDVHTQFAAFDERWIYVDQTIRPRGGEEVCLEHLGHLWCGIQNLDI